MYYLMGIWIYITAMTQGDKQGKKRLLTLTGHKQGEMKLVLYLELVKSICCLNFFHHRYIMKYASA